MVLDDGHLRLEIVDTSAELLRMHATYAPGSPLAPRHYHPVQEERFQVEAGAVWFQVEGAARTLEAGSSLIVPAGAVHRARNASGESQAVVIWEVRPARRTVEFFEALFALTRHGRPGPLGIAPIAREFRQEWVLASPPRAVQTCLFGILAPIARLRAARG